jgi:hypothetical protein
MKNCSVCDKLVCIEDIYTCEVCKKDVGPDCIVRDQNAPDDFKDVCVECVADKYEGGR